MKDASPDPEAFPAHIELLQLFLAHRETIVGRIEGVLNAQRKPTQFLQDRHLLSRELGDCFFALTAIDAGQSRLRGQLEQAHWASGFRPRTMAGLHNDLIDPAEMAIRAFYCWQQTRWPGRNGRVRYAHTLFNVYLIRSLELLSMRLWDEGSTGSDARLANVQELLDELWKGSPPDQPVLVRDARWLIPLALSPTTDELAGYFEVAHKVAASLTEDDRTEIGKAAAQMIGGHLRSQIRHYCLQDAVSIDERSVVLRTRTSNAPDLALLIQYLVPLLEAYEQALRGGEEKTRLALASSICQGISPDPALFINRLDLLGPYSMIEHLFVATDPDGPASYTEMGQRHVQLLQTFEALIGRLSEDLYEDCLRFRPIDGGFSPYGAIFGTPSNLTEHMALKALQRDAEARFTLEDVFTDGDADKLHWVNDWRKLPHIEPQVQRLHEYPQAFAEEVFNRIEAALRTRACDDEASSVPQTGRLILVSGGDLRATAESASIPDLSPAYLVSSDSDVVAAKKAEPYDQTQLLRDRLEGHFLFSFETSGGWVAIRKDFLTEVLGAGRDVKIPGLPIAAVEAIELMCPAQASVPPSMLKA